MIAGAEAELGKRRVNDLLTRERLLGPAAKVTTYSTPRRLGGAGGGVLASQADTKKAHRPLVEGRLQRRRAHARRRSLCEEGRRACRGARKSHQRQGRICRRNRQAQGPCNAELLLAELPKEV
jgi:hypothetical protein